METVSVIIGTFGDKKYWDKMAEPAIESVLQQSVKPVQLLRYHGKDLAHARNTAACAASGDWLCFLDADDRLEAGYLNAMLNGEGDLRYPAIRYVDEGKGADSAPITIFKKRPIAEANYMVIGTFVRREQFLRLGGFTDHPAYEDWVLWIRCIIDGARSNLIEDAVYQATVRKGSRNKLSGKAAQELYDQIRARYKSELPESERGSL